MLEMAENTTTLLVTFGQVHVHSVDGKTFDKDCVAKVAGNTPGTRDRVRELFGDKFFTTYQPEKQFDPTFMRHFPRGVIEV